MLTLLIVDWICTLLHRIHSLGHIIHSPGIICANGINIYADINVYMPGTHFDTGWMDTHFATGWMDDHFIAMSKVGLELAILAIPCSSIMFYKLSMVRYIHFNVSGYKIAHNNCFIYRHLHWSRKVNDKQKFCNSMFFFDNIFILYGEIQKVSFLSYILISNIYSQ